MPVIAVVSSKGGVGKTTSTIILAGQFARLTKVKICDADPNQPAAAWAELGNVPENLEVIPGVTEDNIIDVIEQAEKEAQFVFVDCAGYASTAVAYAIASAHLVIIPMQGSQLDAREAGRALGLVKKSEKMGRRKIPVRLLITRTNPTIRTKNLDNLQSQFRDAGVGMFETHLNEREAFKSVFSIGGTLENLTPNDVGGLEKAIENARRLTMEVADVLRAEGASE